MTRVLRERHSDILRRVYPTEDAGALTDAVVVAFWPDRTQARKRPRKPGNALWSQQDALMITYGNSIVDGAHKTLDLLLDFLLERMQGVVNGVRSIRLDAVAFLWKEVGAASIHMPRTHAIIQLMRVLEDIAGETVILLTETNVPKAENLGYFGQRNEAHAIYNFPLPPLILHAMLSGTAKYLRM